MLRWVSCVRVASSGEHSIAQQLCTAEDALSECQNEGDTALPALHLENRILQRERELMPTLRMVI
jgi:hypothetical protein